MRCPLGLRIILVAVVGLVLGCAADDGRTVRQSASSDVTPPAEAPGLTVGSPGSSQSDDDAAPAEAGRGYASYLRAESDDAVAATVALREAVRAGDLDAARAAYVPSRQSWERIEPIARLVPPFDGAAAADPMAEGWDELDRLLWDVGTCDGASGVANELADRAQQLRADLFAREFTSAALAVGAAELVEEIAPIGVDTDEPPAARVDAWDVAGNTAGARTAFELLTPGLDATHHELVVALRGLFAQIDARLATYRADDVPRGYDSLTDADRSALQATLTELTARLSAVAGAVGVG